VPVTPERLPESVLRYVTRTRSSVILDDAQQSTPFEGDPYVRRTAVRSVLCLPLMKQAELIGVLYLENDLAPNVFTPARIEVLHLLASQAAVSLQNARLYATVRQQEQELRTLIDVVPQQIFVLRSDLHTEYANGAILDYHGAQLASVLFDGDLERRERILHHPDDLPYLQEEGGRALSAGVPVQLEGRLLGKNGEYRWFLIRMNPLRDADGRIVRWYGTRTDIHDRKVAEQRAQQEERELRQLVDFIPQKIAVLRADGSFLHANRALLDYIAQPLEEVVAADDVRAAICHPEDLERVRHTIRSLAQGKPCEVEVRTRRHDGVFRWHLVRYEPLRDADGQITRWYATATDIEDRKLAEERIREENLALREEIDKASMFEEIVGVSGPLRTVLGSISKVAPTESTVLITGETGTGKELVARAIHKRSRRASRAFVNVNCAAIPASLIASELFGHEKGAFTGALQRRLGRFELADGGTIFLDEIGDLPPDTQLALLRVLQEREFERVGGTRPIKVDVRVITATNRDLEAAMADGSFRSDLFYRLDVFPIAMPSLRARKRDIPLLVAYFLERYASRSGKPIRQVDRRTLEMLEAYHWPGNIRELQNVIERSVIVCESDTLTVDESWLSHGARPATLPSPSLNEEIVRRERQMIEAALAESGGRVSGPLGAAVKLGIPASTLDSKIRALKIDKHRFRGSSQ
jgi:formate hydrogenlyase transcriptional activator